MEEQSNGGKPTTTSIDLEEQMQKNDEYGESGLWDVLCNRHTDQIVFHKIAF